MVQSCPTRWDSIYFMCDVLYRNRSAVCAILGDRAYTNSSTALNLEISEHGWGIMEGLITLLKPLHVATKFLCSETKVTFSAKRPVVQTLISNHYGPKPEDNNPVTNFKSSIVYSLKKRFTLEDDSCTSEDFEVLPEQIACFLDPRYKDLRWKIIVWQLKSVLRSKMISEMSTTELTVKESGKCDDQELDFLFATEEQMSDTISQFERVVAEPQIANRLDPLVWWRSREHSYLQLRLWRRDI